MAAAAAKSLEKQIPKKRDKLMQLPQDACHIWGTLLGKYLCVVGNLQQKEQRRYLLRITILSNI